MPALTTRLTPALSAEYAGGGFWPGLRFGELLRRRAEERPGKTALVDGRRRLTYAELDALADRLAGGLRARGVGAGEVVSCILPNRAEAAVLCFAAARLGAILNPIVPILGAREVSFILREAESVCLVVPEAWRGVDYRALAERVAPAAPALRELLVLGEELPEALLAASAPPPPAAAGPDDVAVILYTSGTTAEPKGVLHSHNTLLAECASIARFYGLGAEDVLVMASPVSHISGLFYGVLLPVFLGATSALMESWDPEGFLDLVEREGGTFSAGATPFLQGLLDAASLGRRDLRRLRVFACGGADVPPELIRRAKLRLGLRCGRGYGSTEFPSITSGTGLGVPDDKRAETDGAPIPPNQVELRDEAGRPVAPGEVGEIWARGPELCLGYRNPAQNAGAFDARGFFRTGDLGRLDGEGYLTLTGRVKDIIVRGGEKFSAKEIEDLLFGHPQVRAVAVVPFPDPALGERVCAVIVPRDPESPPSLPELVRFLEGREISRRKLPERLELVAELPLTASGKVQKQLLRERLNLLWARRPGAAVPEDMA